MLRVTWRPETRACAAIYWDFWVRMIAASYLLTTTSGLRAASNCAPAQCYYLSQGSWQSAAMSVSFNTLLSLEADVDCSLTCVCLLPPA